MRGDASNARARCDGRTVDDVVRARARRDAGDATPRPLARAGNGGGARATREGGRARSSVASSVSARDAWASERASERGRDERGWEGGRAVRWTTRTMDDSAETVRAREYVSDTDAIEARDGEEAKRASRARDDAYVSKREGARAARVRGTDSRTQTLETLRLDARTMTTTTKRETRGAQADEFHDARDDLSEEKAREIGELRVRIEVVRTIEVALRERERLHYNLMYRGLRPANDGKSPLTELASLICDHTNGMNVSCVKFNPAAGDLVCVAYGEFSFAGANSRERREKGALAFWSLQSEAPIHVVKVESGVLSVDWSSADPNLLAVGCYDGDVVVFDCGNLKPNIDGESSLMSSHTTLSEHLHNDPVWAVKWIDVDDADEFDCDETLATTRVLMSASTDGRVVRWDVHNQSHASEVLAVRWSPPGNENQSEGRTTKTDLRGEDLVRLGGVMCFDFFANSKHYVIGTEEGKIHKCSLSFSDQYLSSYAPHIGPVYALKINPYHDRVFITCSADWTMRVFLDDASKYDDEFNSVDESSSRLKLSKLIQPRFVIEYGQSPINSVEWSPWCSTEFAAATDAGTIEIWDLASSSIVPKHELQITDDRTAAVSVSYARESPVIIVGCASGSTRMFRINWRDPTDGIAATEIQRDELERALNVTLK